MSILDIQQIIILSLVGAIFALILRERTPQIAIILTLATGVIIFISVCEPLYSLISILTETANVSGVPDSYFSIVLKIISIAYLSQFGSQLCKDVGEGAIAMKIELAGKILIMSTATPILSSVLNIILTFY